MPSFADSIFLFVLALLLFGPKKLPVLARELGKWMGEFRRASNEFKMQMEDELRASEQAERQKQIAAMEAAAPIPPPLGEPAEPEHPHMRYAAAAAENTILPPEAPEPSIAAEATTAPASESASLNGVQNSPVDAATPSLSAAQPAPDPERSPSPVYPVEAGTQDAAEPPEAPNPIPIATSGSLKMMPPATGLPTPRRRGGNGALATLVDAIPETTATSPTAESVAHGD